MRNSIWSCPTFRGTLHSGLASRATGHEFGLDNAVQDGHQAAQARRVDRTVAQANGLGRWPKKKSRPEGPMEIPGRNLRPAYQAS